MYYWKLWLKEAHCLSHLPSDFLFYDFFKFNPSKIVTPYRQITKVCVKIFLLPYFFLSLLYYLSAWLPAITSFLFILSIWASCINECMYV